LRLLLPLGAVLLVAAAYFALFGGDYDVFELHRIRAERAAEEQRAADVAADVERIRARRDSLLHDSATIERVARERYGMIRDGERLYRFTEPPASPEPPPEGGSAAGAPGVHAPAAPPAAPPLPGAPPRDTIRLPAALRN
jgi:cell division protein FtsB